MSEDEMSDDDRLRRFIIPEREMIAVLEGRIRVRFDLPDDVRVVAVYHDYTCRGVAVVVRSSQFEPVPPGEVIPALPPLLMETV